MTQALNKGMEVIIPEGTAMRIISRDTFQKYKETVSGLNAGDTQRKALNKLVQLGLATIIAHTMTHQRSGEVHWVHVKVHGHPTLKWVDRGLDIQAPLSNRG
jgi:hypothetical protein